MLELGKRKAHMKVGKKIKGKKITALIVQMKKKNYKMTIKDNNGNSDKKR